IGEHSFSTTLAKNRPDEMDMIIINQFANIIIEKAHNFSHEKNLVVPGHQPLKPYFQPKGKNGNVFDFTKITPTTNTNCINCKVCARACPMGSIDNKDVSKLNGICIKCCAYVKSCPVGAKYFDDPNYIKHQKELEINFTKRCEPEIFY